MQASQAKAQDAYDAAVKTASDKRASAHTAAKAAYDKQVAQNASDYAHKLNEIKFQNKTTHESIDKYLSATNALLSSNYHKKMAALHDIDPAELAEVHASDKKAFDKEQADKLEQFKFEQSLQLADTIAKITAAHDDFVKAQNQALADLHETNQSKLAQLKADQAKELAAFAQANAKTLAALQASHKVAYDKAVAESQAYLDSINPANKTTEPTKPSEPSTPSKPDQGNDGNSGQNNGGNTKPGQTNGNTGNHNNGGYNGSTTPTKPTVPADAGTVANSGLAKDNVTNGNGKTSTGINYVSGSSQNGIDAGMQTHMSYDPESGIYTPQYLSVKNDVTTSSKSTNVKQADTQTVALPDTGVKEESVNSQGIITAMLLAVTSLFAGLFTKKVTKD